MSENEQAIEPLIVQELKRNVLWLTFNRPKQRNPLSAQMLIELTAALEAANNDSQVRAIVIAAQGPVFCAGHDLTEMARHDGEDKASQQQRIRKILNLCSTMMLTMIHSPKAIIACVQGTATAAGCQLVSVCDLAYAADSTKFCTPGVSIGGFCTTPLVGIGRNIHRKHAMEMALTGDFYTAAEAKDMGLINDHINDDDLHAHVAEMAERIASKSAQGIRHGKADFYQQIDMPVEKAFEYANEAMVTAMTTEDALEGSAAFFEKRSPVWGDA